MITEYERFHLKPIGKFNANEAYNTALISDNYKKALKHLDTFSHALLFTKNNDSIIYNIVKIVKIDMNNGVIYTDDTTSPDGTIIYDIKPYFGCEDNVFLPSNTSTKWKKEEANISYTKIDPNALDKTLTDANQKVDIKGEYKFINDSQTLLMDDNYTNRLEGYEYARVIWWFDRLDKKQYRNMLVGTPPYANAPECGIFATRSPIRPNPIASTVVKILEIQNNNIKILGFDGFENSMIIDIYPYKQSKEKVSSPTQPSWLSHWAKLKTFNMEKKVNDNITLPESDTLKFRNIFITDDIYLNTDNDKKALPSVHKHVINNISVVNAHQNNLKNIDVNIPKNKITVITGVSGSGKSSLAFDTIYTESNRQFMSIMSKGMDNHLEKPHVDEISGLQPAVAINQKSLALNPRSTVGTTSGVSELLRLLYVSIGTRHCPECHKAVDVISSGEIASYLQRLEDGTLLAIHPYNNAKDIKTLIVDNSDVNNKSQIEITVKQSLDKGNGAIYLSINDSEPLMLQTKTYCYHCDTILFDISSSVFSANNPEYMCPTCKGLGYEYKLDENLIVSNPEKSILDGASKWWNNMRKHSKKPNANWMRGEVLALADDMGVDLDTPYRDLPEDFKHQLMYGSNGRKVSLAYENNTGRKGIIEREAEGAINIINRLLKDSTSSKGVDNLLNSFLNKTKCSHCDGERLKPEGRLIEINSLRYPKATKMKIVDLRKWLQSLYGNLPKEKVDISRNLIDRLLFQIDKIIDMGLSYLALDRQIPSLSGGEVRRLQLASQFGTNLTNILYVLDEPTKGLHPYDYKHLIEKIKELRDMQNTVILVEHEKDMIVEADYLIDIGPGAGKYGGEVVACGTPEEIRHNEDSITGKHLKDNAMQFEKTANRKSAHGNITITGASENNLKNIDVSFPLGRFITVTGVSGSGKSSLVSKTLYPAICKKLGKSVDESPQYKDIRGIENIKDIIWVSQRPIGRTPKSNPATYTGVFDLIRNVYAKTDKAKELGYKKDSFSFNSKRGQCSVCNGIGKIKTSMSFMNDICTECNHCRGKRYRKEILEVKYNDYSIADILDMEVSEALPVFSNDKKISAILQMICNIGLSYIKLGQSALTISGGEAQRLKLAKELSAGGTRDTIYILDEPTTGLHMEDIKKLIFILQSLVDNGNTVIAIEHNMDFIVNSDWVIDLGPSGGDNGGYIVSQGTPEEVSHDNNSITGTMLKNYY